MYRRNFVLAIMAAGLLWGCSSDESKDIQKAQEAPSLVRAHSPVVGPAEAPVTITEFFDPSCEACRAFYPFVKKILSEHSGDVRLVIRYVPFHRGSEEAVRILETARMQGVYEPVLEAILKVQPQWHDDPQLKAAWDAAAAAGLDVQRARKQAAEPSIAGNLAVDIEDAKAYSITRTPTFFVNGKPVEPFGPEQLYNLVRSEVAQAKKPEGD